MNNSQRHFDAYAGAMSRGLRITLATVLATASMVVAVEPLTTVEAVRHLKPEDAAQSLPVKLEAVVTYYHPDWGVLFTHDGRAGICVGIAEEARPAEGFALGKRLLIEGVTGPGEFLPVILPSILREVGTGELPPYEKVTGEELFVPGMDCHPVEVEAVVKGTWFGDESLVVELQIGSRAVKAVMPRQQSSPQLPWQLLERHVRVRGIAGTHFNDQRQMSGRLLFVQGVDSFLLAEPSETVSEAPIVPVDGLLRVDAPLHQRVRVRGNVTHVATGRGLYLRGQGGSLFVQTAQPLSIETADDVEAEGYPLVTAFRPSLSAVDVRQIGRSGPPQPVAFHAERTRHSSEQCELVTLDAHFLEMTPGREGLSLTCGAKGRVFEATLQNTTGLLELLPGMTLRLTGICESSSTHPPVIARNATGFRIRIRSPEDIVILASPPWWTSSRVLWVLGIVGGLALLVGIPLGVYAALRRGKFGSQVAMTVSLLGVSLPTFLIGILLILVFAVVLNVLPSFGRGETVAFGTWTTGLLTVDGIKHLVLPALTLSIFQLALILRLVRAEMLEVLRADYIKFARARGLPDRVVHFGHALKNTLVPVITITGLQLGGLIAFAIVTETVFQWPGIGRWMAHDAGGGPRPHPW